MNEEIIMRCTNDEGLYSYIESNDIDGLIELVENEIDKMSEWMQSVVNREIDWSDLRLQLQSEADELLSDSDNNDD